MNPYKARHAMFVLLMTGALALSAAEQSSSATNTSPQPEKVRTVDFAWMTGRWIGHFADSPAVITEQICSHEHGGEMLCLFRLMVNGKAAMFELYTMQDTPTGVELRSLHFSTDLNQKQAQPPLVMRLTKYGAKEIVFSGVPNSEVLTSTLERDSPRSMNGTIVMTDPKAGQIHVRWEKMDYTAELK